METDGASVPFAGLINTVMLIAFTFEIVVKFLSEGELLPLVLALEVSHSHQAVALPKLTSTPASSHPFPPLSLALKDMDVAIYLNDPWNKLDLVCLVVAYGSLMSEAIGSLLLIRYSTAFHCTAPVSNVSVCCLLITNPYPKFNPPTPRLLRVFRLFRFAKKFPALRAVVEALVAGTCCNIHVKNCESLYLSCTLAAALHRVTMYLY